MSGVELTERLAALQAGQVNGPGLIAAFREALLLAPTENGKPLAADSGGVRWLYAFTDESALARFASARGLEPPVEYLTVYGRRLLDVAVPALGVPAGVALDAAGPVPFALPPAVAVDRG
ncbi:SseB family protein [Kitasatospora sp. NBC_01266]|uniref:SseB family protein n=1 Tax=Kitasatospora sp. NBC_01266 TaxID=2903572 RepID=UPI002E325050|nr:SseB family protein [Kitasatospora sp. NBC_01266]